jgi:hypothetical protein
MDRRLPRRKPLTRLTLSIAAVALAVPGFAACGFNYATDRENTIVNGTSNKDGEVDVLNAVIVSGETGSGTFIASLSNNDTGKPISLESLDFGSNSTTEVAGFSPIEVPPGGFVSLADGKGIKLSGEFEAGEFLGLTLTFDNGDSAEMDVPVVTEDDEYTDLDNGTGVPSPAASESAPAE